MPLCSMKFINETHKSPKVRTYLSVLCQAPSVRRMVLCGGSWVRTGGSCRLASCKMWPDAGTHADICDSLDGSKQYEKWNVTRTSAGKNADFYSNSSSLHHFQAVIVHKPQFVLRGFCSPPSSDSPQTLDTEQENCLLMTSEMLQPFCRSWTWVGLNEDACMCLKLCPRNKSCLLLWLYILDKSMKKHNSFIKNLIHGALMFSQPSGGATGFRANLT